MLLQEQFPHGLSLSASLQGHESDVVALAWIPSGAADCLISGSNDRTVRLWNVETETSTCCLRGHTQCVDAVASLADGRGVVSASWDGTARVWDSNSQNEILTLRGHQGTIWMIHLSPGGETLATASSDHTVWIWDLKTGKDAPFCCRDG